MKARDGYTKADSRSHTKFFITLIVILTLIQPGRLSAEETFQQENQTGVLDSITIHEIQLAYYENLSQELTDKAEKLVGKRQGQCVVAVRNFLEISRNEIQGAAKTLKINSKTPQIGSIIKLKMSKYGHVGVVLSFTNDTVTYFDSNGDWKQKGSIREISLDDERIQGYRIVTE